MNHVRYSKKILYIFVILLMCIISLFGDLPIFIFIYIYFAFVLVIRLLLGKFDRKAELTLLMTYLLLMALQVHFSAYVVFTGLLTGISFYLAKLFAISSISVPWFIDRFVTTSKQKEFSPPSVEDVATISFEEMFRNKERIMAALEDIHRVKKTVTPQNLNATLGDLHRHSFIQYINDGTLTKEYFDKAYESLDDPYLYIIISNTGSAASELISLFTKRQYNHASLSFDGELKTIVSYNGGANVYPPGLNPEIIEAFHQKADASILVYRLKASKAQKKLIIDKLQEINRDGSAYNILGLLTKHSSRPNIMFCSQFVYKMLKLAELDYFEKKEGQVQPTDFIEQDYKKKLEYYYEIKFQ